MWDILKVMYDNDPLMVFEIYKHLFDLKQGDRSVLEFYSELKGLIDKLKMYQPAVTDAATLRGYRQDFVVSKFVSGLSPAVGSQVQGQILGGDSIPTLIVTFLRVMPVYTGSEISSAPSIE